MILFLYTEVYEFMLKVGFISPDGEVSMCCYSNLLTYCKKLCEKKENREKFEEFKKDYTYFPPYFDFVMFELKYIFINPLFSKQEVVIQVRDALYKNKLDGFDYQANVLAMQEEMEWVDMLPFITKCSDSELGIQKEEPLVLRDVLIDCNLMGMMSKSGTIQGSHAITANTVLNQLMMLSPKIEESYFCFLEQEGMDPDNDALRYLIESFGFMRVTAFSKYIIGNEKCYTRGQKEFVKERQNIGFQCIDFEKDADNLVDLYQDKLKRH